MSRPPVPDGAASGPYDVVLVRRLERSHRAFVGTDLVPRRADETERARWLYEDAPFGVLAHDGDHDPRFIYANRAAQRCFEYPLTELVGTPSRLTADHDAQQDREALLATVAAHGYADGYRGSRIARSGRRFWIEDVLMWTLLDDQGAPCGQAAMIRQCSDVDLISSWSGGAPHPGEQETGGVAHSVSPGQCREAGTPERHGLGVR